MKKRTHMIIPVFIPHQGCPYLCVYCNQQDITGVPYKTDENQIKGLLTDYLSTHIRKNMPSRKEVAFYGGSFTGLPLDKQKRLLDSVTPWIKEGWIHTVRLSTHCLYIDRTRLELLKKYPVETIELGVQSTDPKVLELSGRPCPKESLVKAVNLIREYGFSLGLQLMSGLPGDNEKTFQRSVQDTLGLKPDFVRLYPTLVLRHSPLYHLYRQGKYSPWDMETTIVNMKKAVKKFRDAGIPVVRLGLHADPSLLENLVAGPYHPSLRYLVDCRIRFDEMVEKISSLRFCPKSVVFKVPAGKISQYIGHKRENLVRLKKLFSLRLIRVEPEENLETLKLVA